MIVRTFAHRIGVAVLVIAAAAGSVAAETNKKKIEFTTSSKEARECVMKMVFEIETFQFIPDNPLAKKAVEADPNFAFGYYMLATAANTPEDARKYGDKAIELSKKASDGERRYIEAVLMTRAQKLSEALTIFLDLSKNYPGDRMVQMLLGQVYTNMGKLEDAKAAFERAIEIDGSTPRAYTFVGNISLLKGDYSKARQLFKQSLAKQVKNSAPFGPYYGLAYADIYEGNYKSAVKKLEEYLGEYKKSQFQQQQPEVFIWNSIARLHLESGDAQEALVAYQKGYESVPRSQIDDMQKRIWLGRMHHGTARSLAKMGKKDEAWKEVDSIKKMIEDGGKDGEPFWPAYHYLAGYVKLESGDYSKALEHLKQANADNDPFQKLLLARAYEKSGDQEAAQKLYKEITDFNQVTLERALSYPEAKRKLKT